MLYNISVGKVCPRCTPDLSKLTNRALNEWFENWFEFTKEHECPFRSHTRKGQKWSCYCCSLCEFYCSKYYRPYKSNELRKEIKAAYGVWL